MNKVLNLVSHIEPKGRDSRKQIAIFKKITKFFNLKDMFGCYEHHCQLHNIWKTIRII